MVPVQEMLAYDIRALGVAHRHPLTWHNGEVEEVRDHECEDARDEEDVKEIAEVEVRAQDPIAADGHVEQRYDYKGRGKLCVGVDERVQPHTKED